MEPRPPVAAQVPHQVGSPHGTREDPYFWLRDDARTSEVVRAHLRAENAYSAAVLAPMAGLQETLYQEMVGRLKEDDSSVPVLERGAWLYTRYEPGKQYPILCRRKGTMTAPEEILIDSNARAAGRAYYSLGDWAVSPDGRRIAFTEDVVGGFLYRLHVIDLATGAELPDGARDVANDVEWSADGLTLFYIVKDPRNLRERTVMRHRLGTTAVDDVVIHDEPDGAFTASLSTTKSRDFIAIELDSTRSSEVRLIDTRRPEVVPRVFLPRELDHEYAVDHLDDRFVVVTNWQAPNFRVMTASVERHADRSTWRDLVPHREDALIETVALYHGFTAVGERSGGLRKVRVLPARGAPFLIDATEPTYVMFLVDTPEPDTGRVRYAYQSMVTPPSTYELDVATGTRTLLRRQEVLGGFDPDAYQTDYLHVPSADGALVPVSIVHKKGLARDGTAPLVQIGYGAYGISNEPRFISERLSLLDRGFVIAVAHVRGGQELGRRWYQQGRQLAKRNTFTDFITVTEHLVAKKIAAPDKVFAAGVSAGGLLVGAVANMRPELYRGIIAGVPFVDIVTTMLDDSLPLTSNEFDEWGDPRVQPFHDAMLSYSPYDNVGRRGYPWMLVTTGLHDSQVQYWEPAKWVAKLRALKTDQNPVLLRVELEAGHTGRSGRYDKLRDTARDFAFYIFVLEQPDRRRERP